MQFVTETAGLVARHLDEFLLGLNQRRFATVLRLYECDNDVG
ncbi:hypothetical protein C7S13_4682 [Burkholderia cepacia]|nr:hypothetical protein [Burkholderia cepacia]